jgi:hypothetical protein
MTQQQVIQEFSSYPRATKSAVIRILLRIFEADSVDSLDDRKELTVEERLAIVESLSGVASVKGKIPPTDEEWREERTNYLSEKYK